MGALTNLRYQGRDVGIADYLRDTPIITELHWNPEGLADIDLRGT